jgi:hypothetical protein
MAGSLNLDESPLFKTWETGGMLEPMAEPMQAESVCPGTANETAPELTADHQAASPKAVEQTASVGTLEQQASSCMLQVSGSSSSGHNKMTMFAMNNEALSDADFDAAAAASLALGEIAQELEAKKAETEQVDSQMAGDPEDFYLSSECPNNRQVPSKPGFIWEHNDQLVWDWAISRKAAKADCNDDEDLQIGYQ